MNRPPIRRARPGFTLIELLVVIVIISILIGLLIPAVMSAVRRAREAQVAAEIQTLAQSLQDFKTKYGDFPPSKIILMENGFFDTNPQTNPNYYGLCARTLRYMRKFFPKANFSTTGVATINGVAISASTAWYDFNGNGHLDTNPIILEGHECLVFFLGGIPNPNIVNITTGQGSGTFAGVGGFSNNPANPFVSESVLPSPRSRPMFEFKADRLRDFSGTGFGMPSYLDSLGTGSDGRAFLYFSAYGGDAYDPNDENTGAPEDAGTSQQFGPTTLPVASAAPNPYTTTAPVPKVGSPKYINPESYQIISAGADRIYGVGGQYTTSTGSGERLPVSGFESPAISSRQNENDNITNFSTGTLQ